MNWWDLTVLWAALGFAAGYPIIRLVHWWRGTP